MLLFHMKLNSFWSFSWSFLRHYKFKLFTIIFLSSFSLYIAGNISSDYLASFTECLSGDVNQAIFFGIMYVVLWAGSDVLDYIYRWISSTLYPKIERDIRIECYDYVQQSKFSYFRGHGPGLIENYIDCAAEGVREIWVDLCESIIPSMFFIIIAIIKFFMFDYRFAIITISWIVIRSVFFYFLSKELLKDSKTNFALAHQRTNLMIDLLQNIQLNKIFNLKKYFKTNILNIHNKETRAFEKFLSRSAIIGFLTGINAAAFFGFLIYTIVIGLKSGSLTIAKATSVIIVANWLAYIVWDRSKKIVEMFENYGQACHSLTEMQSCFREIEQGDQKCKSFDIEIKNLTFGFGDKLLFNNFNLSIPAGSKVAIVGSSGSGKSTLLYLINKLINCDRDQIFIGGVDICDIKTDFIKSRIGFISQSSALLNSSIAENVQIGNLDADENRMQEALSKAKGDFISDLNLDVGQSGNGLSGGQAQRICIARALIRDNVEILCADEPTSALDTVTRREVIENIFTLYKDQTILWIDHSLESAKFVDIIILFYHDQIYIGSHKDLYEKHEFYRSLF